MILILTLAQDLHALEVRKAVQKIGYKDICIVETDKISNTFPLSITLDKSFNENISIKLTENNGKLIDLSDCKTIWLRRPFAQQLKFIDYSNDEFNYIDNECRAGMGSSITCANFQGNWISNPDATLKASDKIFQLQTALKTGFKIPKTIVSQSKKEIIDFYNQCKKKIIVKPLLGVSDRFIVTKQLHSPHLISDDAYTCCPAIYQELITGTKHVRLNAFGKYKIAALIESDDLDWRPNLNVPISKWEIPQYISNQIDNILELLGLKMGIFDFKINKKGELVWFEVNPQGQFLFLEPFLKDHIADKFAQFLIDNANAKNVYPS